MAADAVAATLRVVVVDDTRHVREMLATMLELDGFDVVGTAAGGADAVTLVRRHTPDVVVLDYKMPGMDGLEATRRIRRSFPALPIVLYTAYLDETVEHAAREAGVDLCIGKIEGLATLERELTDLCERRAASPRAPGHAAG